jgi:hypothetical protein
MTCSAPAQRALRVLCVGLTLLITTSLLVAAPGRLGLRKATASNTSAIRNVLDDFNRPGPELGSNWSSTSATLANNQLKGDTDSQFYWQQSFGASQWASIKIVRLPRCSRVELFLKASGNSKFDGLVDVSYDTCATPQLLIYSYNPKFGHHSPFNGTNVALGEGDVFSVSVHANHVVTVFINGAAVLSDVLATENAGFDVGRAGQIGLGLSSSNVVLDDFDGGSLDGSVPPTPSPATPTPQAYDEAVFLPWVSSPKKR